MSIRDVISKVHVPYRPVVYAVVWAGMALMMAATFLPTSLFFLKYIGIVMALAGFLYMSFWIYKGGYKKEAMLMGTISTAFAAIIIIMLAYYFNLLYGMQS